MWIADQWKDMNVGWIPQAGKKLGALGRLSPGAAWYPQVIWNLRRRTFRAGGK